MTRIVGPFMRLKIFCKDEEVVLDNVIEYVSGKLFFYVHVRQRDGKHTVRAISRDIIEKVNRINDDGQEWTVNLPKFNK